MYLNARQVPFAGILTIVIMLCGPHARAGEPARGAAPPPVDLEALLAEADAANPRILAARARLEAAGHVAPQVEALPDPLAGVSYTNDGLDQISLGDSVMSNVEVSWSQEVPYPGKRRLAGDVARAEVSVAAQRLEEVRLEVRSALKSACVELYRIDRTRLIVDENRRLLETMKEAARARYESGQAILENVLRAQTELTRVDVDLTRLDEERTATVAMVNALLNRGQDVPLGPVIALPSGAVPDPAAAESAARRHAPGLRALAQQVEVEEARLAQAKRALKPDFVWSAAYKYRADIDPMVMGGFGIRLPLYKDRKQSQRIAEAGVLVEAARLDEQRAEANLAAQVRELIARARRAEDVARLYDEGILPQSRAARDASLAAYTNGQTDFITVVTDQLATLRDEIALESQRAEMLSALASLEPLTGLELVTAPGGRP